MGKENLVQWVNLTKNRKWVEDEINSVERVGYLQFKVTFTDAKLANFQVDVKPRGGNTNYDKGAGKEYSRNQNFHIRYGRGSETNLAQKEVRLQRNVWLPAAGGNKYVVRVLYNGKTTESVKEITARRKLFYYSVKMDSSARPAAERFSDPSSVLASTESDYEKYFLTLKKRGDATMPFTQVLLMEEKDDQGNAIGNAWGATRAGLLSGVKTALAANRADLQKRKHYTFAIVWCNYIADKGKTVFTQWATTSDNSQVVTASFVPSWFGRLFNYQVSNQSLYLHLDEWLWHGLDDGDDANQHWLESVELFFKDDATKVDTRIPIPNNRVTIADPARFTFGGHAVLRVDLSAADMAGVQRRVLGRVAGKFYFRVTVRTVTGWTNGFSVPQINVIVVADKAQWQKNPDDKRVYTLNHELGHKIGMTSQGGKVAAETFNQEGATDMPDFPAKLYGNINDGSVDDNSNDHSGNHCGNGANWDPGTQTWSGSPTCVMFGADGVYNGNTLSSAPPAYCDLCKPVVVKLDLGDAMIGFTNCVTD